MLFMKSGTLREALGVARDEKMLDGQDPLVVMKGCSEARLHAPVMVEIEVSGGKSAPPPGQETRGGTATLIPEEPTWPVLLKMYVSVAVPPFRRDTDPSREWYLFARRLRHEQSISGFLAHLSEKQLNFVMNVR